MKAIVARVQIDIDYKCPNCFLHFRLSNSKVPQKKDCSVTCPECNQKLTVPALFKKSKKKRTPKTNNTLDPVIKSAESALKVNGFTKTEATQLINKTYRKGISVAELIKGCLKNVETAKAN